MEVKLAIGIRDGQPIHVSELDSATENGLKCECTCPYCGGDLEAKLGSKRQWHFAHHTRGKEDCSDLRAQETGLHLMAKQIILDNSIILVPGFELAIDDVAPNPLLISVFAEFAEAAAGLPYIEEAKRVGYVSADTEVAIDDIRSDVVITTAGGRRCSIEIVVTHASDERKRKKLEALELPTFEIDLSPLPRSSDSVSAPKTLKAIEEAVLSDEKNRHWVFNPKMESVRGEKRKRIQEEYANAMRKGKADLEKKREKLREYDSLKYKRDKEEEQKTRVYEEITSKPITCEICGKTGDESEFWMYGLDSRIGRCYECLHRPPEPEPEQMTLPLR